MSKTEIGNALAGAVARMEANRRSAGTALATAPSKARYLTLSQDADGVVCLPPVPYVPAAPEALGLAVRMARVPEPEPVKDTAGRVIFRHVKGGPLRVAADVRAQAAERRAMLDAILEPLAAQEVIEEWFRQWAMRCSRPQGTDYAAWEADQYRACRMLPGLAFNDDTAALAAQTFDWLPTPAKVHKLLTEWLAPLVDERDGLRVVETALDPLEKARERPADAPLTPEEVAERKAAARRAIERREQELEAMRREGRLPFSSHDRNPQPSEMKPFQVCLAAASMIDADPLNAETYRRRIAYTVDQMRAVLAEAKAKGGAVGADAKVAERQLEAAMLGHRVLASFWSGKSEAA